MQEQFFQEIKAIFGLFFDDEPVSVEIIDTSRGEADFREVVIVELKQGGKAVLKLSDNDFTSADKIKMWQRTAEEYRRLGYYCPRIIADKTGGFPRVAYKGRSCVVYAEEYAMYRTAETRADYGSENARRYDKHVWAMTAKVAAQYFSYTEYPSAYCLFETFCPSDKTDEVLEYALDWKQYVDTFPDELQPQVERIWRLWTDNRAALEPIYKTLPVSVFQADLNLTNILVDDSGDFVGICDFNLCGREVFLNYLMRETYFVDWQEEINAIFDRLRIASGFYSFSELEKQAALPLYRCLKPLWINKKDKLEELKDDIAATKRYLDETEDYLTRDIDFAGCM